MAGGVAIGGAWINSAHTYVVLSNSRLVHPSPWGVMFWICLAFVVVGIYLFTASYWERLWLPGRNKAASRHMGRLIHESFEKLHEQARSSDPVSIRILSEEPLPLAAPVEYQIAQLSQVVRCLAEYGFTEVDHQMLNSAVRKSVREGVEPMFEPLSIHPGNPGLAELVKRGSLRPTDQPRWFRIERPVEGEVSDEPQD